MTTISVVMTTWQRLPRLLHNSLSTLSVQTVPPLEIVVIDQNPAGVPHVKDNRAVVRQYPLARLVEAPREQFNLSWGMNVGLQATSEEATYVMTTCMEMFFGHNVIEKVLERITEKKMVFSPCGFLPQDTPANVVSDVVTCWDWFKQRVEPNPPVACSSGAMINAAREWWFAARGYDETRPFNYADSDVMRRARMSGLEWDYLLWDECQVLHPWHVPSPLVHTLGGTWPLPEETDWVRNPDGWGRLP